MPRKYILWAMKTKVSLFYSNQLSDCKVPPSYLKKMKLTEYAKAVCDWAILPNTCKVNLISHKAS